MCPQAELGKTKAVEALRTKEAELTALKKKNSRLLKESTKEGKARVKAELDKKVRDVVYRVVVFWWRLRGALGGLTVCASELARVRVSACQDLFY